MWQLALTGLDQRQKAFVTDYDSFAVTPRLNGYRSLTIAGARGSDVASQIEPGSCAIKAWRDGTIRFNGKVWEPLGRKGLAGLSIEARDPVAELVQRRTRIKTTYTAVDAGAIAQDRLTVQNGYRSTYMRNGALQASVNRDRVYLVGVKEGDILDELVGASGGFFYRCDPLDGVAGFMGELVITYPDARTTRPELKLEWGDGTLANLVDYETTDTLPLNRFVAASADTGGTRIEGVAEDAASQLAYGLFEDLDDFTDVTSTTLLTQQAQGSLAPNPQRTLALTCGAEAPLLFVDFNVGDFVRLKIFDPDNGLDLNEWVRVTEATLVVDRDGVETTSSIVVELLVGAGSQSLTPAQLWRKKWDDMTRLLEALGRRAGGFTPPPSGGGGGGGGDEPPDEPPPAEPPPPAPQAPPTVVLDVANATWNKYYNLPAPTAPQLELGGRVNPKGDPTVVWFEYREGVDFPANAPGSPIRATPQRDAGDGTGDVGVGQYVQNLLRNTTYYVRMAASNSGGVTYTASVARITPNAPINIPPD